MKSLDKIDSFDPKYTYKTWLFTIAKRLALQHKIDQKKIINVDVNESSQNDSGEYENRNILITQEEVDDPNETVEYEKHVAMKYNATLAEISKLDIKYRRFLELYNIEGKSYNEIVEIMGVPLQTVKNRLHYGRNKITKIINNKIPKYII
jgi:RNA polymerase sigma-70 factor (ECF subfamily)